MIAAETMTELQLRLWCLWMCEKFAELPLTGYWANFLPAEWAAEGADQDALIFLTSVLTECNTLRAWQLSERMP